MRVIVPGHVYTVQNVDGPGEQTIKFVKRLPKNEPNEAGILMQELLRVLIDRVNFLNEQVPCHENITILENLRESFVLLESRASRRKIEHMLYPERTEPCVKCGHLLCEH
jgi:hypothetical protein